MIPNEWRRIAGVEIVDDGTMAAVWLAHDRTPDVVHLYDCCVFRREVPAVICEGFNARGRWIPIAWEAKAKDMADKLLDRGLPMMPEGVKETNVHSEMTARDIWERMRSGRFKVDKRLGEWLDEFKRYQRHDGKVDRDGCPLMAATQYAIESLPYAKRQFRKTRGQVNYPRLAMI